MPGRVVEISTDGLHLAVLRGFLVVKDGEGERGRVPLDDIDAIIASAHGLTFSANLLHALADRNVPFVVCGPNHMPVSLMLPVAGHHAQTGRVRAQITAPLPLTKRLWQGLVQAKVRNQGAALAHQGVSSGAFTTLARQVRSGDPTNIEAQAARRYWPLLMGTDFRRDNEAGGANALLNYGYAILRSGAARAVVAAGLHPSIGIHHSNKGNPMALVDDVMEPFRPLVDLAVLRLIRAGVAEVTAEAKRDLAAILIQDLTTTRGTTPLSTCLHRLATSLADSYQTGEPRLDLPLSPLPLDLAAGPGRPMEDEDGADWISDHVDDGPV
ncbi:type II CRISPR-associated endonuclease Cas1 [Niveispirillum sp. KHB5.9]|uniref:type II CRISPR-associated endonuclease Cas1 n=1 Tax=Niveispirillum sp. KHB5.9 TaxID=3400269 RepID=UPI003A847997